MTGLDKKVSDFVLDHPKTQEFWKAWTQLLDTVMPAISRRVSRSFLSPSAARAASTAAVAIAEPRPVTWKASVSCEHFPPRPVARQHEGIGLHVVYR